MANVLVTGGAGYVGCHVLLPLIEHGHRPIVLDDFSRGNKLISKLHQNISVVDGRVGDRDLLRKTFRTFNIDAVMHYAALTEIEKSNLTPEEYYKTNAVDTFTLLEEIERHESGVTPALVYSSTCAVFGNPEQMPITEKTPKNPINTYGRSKLMAEWLIEDIGKTKGIPNVILRYFNASGANLQNGTGEIHDPETHIIPLAIRAAREQKPFQINGTDFNTTDGSAIRDFVHVCDLASAHIAALNYLLAGGESNDFNLGTGQGHSVLEVVHTVERITAIKVHIEKSKRRQGDPQALVCDPSKARLQLQWVPQCSDLDVIIGDAAAWDAHLHCAKEVA